MPISQTIIIEVFNTHNFIVELNTNYQDPDFEESYVFGLRTQKLIERKIDFRIL